MTSKKVAIIGGTSYEIHLIVEKLLGGGKENDFFIEIIPEETFSIEKWNSSKVKVHGGFLRDRAVIEYAMKEGGFSSVILNINPWLLSPGDSGYKKEFEIGEEVIGLASTYHVEQFIYLSFLGNFYEGSFFSTKRKLEEKLLSKNFPLATILRPGFYMENFDKLKDCCFHANTFCQPLHSKEKLPLVAFEDIARVICMVITNGNHFQNAKIDLVAENTPMEELAKEIGFDYKELTMEDLPLQYREIYDFFRTQKGVETVQFLDLKNLVREVITLRKFLEGRKLLPVKDWNKSATSPLEKNVQTSTVSAT